MVELFEQAFGHGVLVALLDFFALEVPGDDGLRVGLDLAGQRHLVGVARVNVLPDCFDYWRVCGEESVGFKFDSLLFE